MTFNDPIALLFLIFILLVFLSLLETSTLPPIERILRVGIHASLYTLNAAIILYVMNWMPNFSWNSLRLTQLPSFVQFSIVLLSLDFYSYLFHRLSHRYSFLWYFHQVHHSDIYVEANTALRIHLVQMLLHLLPEFLILSFLQPERDVYLLYLISTHSIVLFHHSRILLPPPVERLLSIFIVTPRVHHQHHALSNWKASPNFGSVFSIWDHLLKTFELKNFPPSYGIPDSKNSFTITELFSPKFRKMGFTQ